MSKRTRKNPDDRREDILVAAMSLARIIGYTNVTREKVAAQAEIHVSLVTHYYGTMPKLKRDIMRRAIKIEDGYIVAQGLACRDPHALKAPNELKQKAAQTIKGL